MHVEDSVQRMQILQFQIDRQKQTIDPANSNSDTLVDSGTAVYPIHIDSEGKWWQRTPLPVSNNHGERLWFYSADTDAHLWAGMQWLDGQ